jgi:hypothetical protein
MGWMVNTTPQPLYLQKSDPVPIMQETGWAPGQSGWVQKISPPLGFDPRTVQSVANHYTDYDMPAHK